MTQRSMSLEHTMKDTGVEGSRTGRLRPVV